MDTSDLDIIKNGLQKIIDEMESLETNRILPDGHPNKAVSAPVSPDASGDPAIMDDKSGTDDASAPSGDMDPGVLDELMNKANSSSDTDDINSDDSTEGLPPEIVAAVANKKKKPLV